MRALSSRKGFSLVELLTVIAIIAILAAIIFPVMGTVTARARQNKCMTQLHEIGMAVQMFKQDNRRYPDILSTEVQYDPSSNIIPFDQCGINAKQNAAGLFPEYVKAARLFHCPNSKVTDTRLNHVQYQMTNPGGSSVDIKIYDYDSYEPLDNVNGASVPRYQRERAPTPTDVPSIPGHLSGRDYQRQLKFRNPPEDTVITWCTAHETGVNQGKVPVVFLDGHVDALPAGDVETQRWCVLPQKG